eukprot:CAMPEP_0206538294 /NCGR_PEP_ID=MMETSP0325_2-20121206/7781_1 /ASSEMBLY_ACC=CAM_ASM_000347 /TAXON_ID=2866 /ORGANISM="Crypthecodinium cohnii, Strain Seligo" /LENGTH=186 /DNA_ID=CAMNT_0054035713 /DNA_START=24 /DNA_END=581 /DNA_ORIENTATION=-
MAQVPIKCLVVDCGGVTNDDSGMSRTLQKYVTEELAADVPLAWKTVWKVHRDNPNSTKAAVWTELCQALRIDVAKVDEMDAEICCTLRKSYPETMELLRRAKRSGLVLGMVSNHIRFWFQECLEASSLDRIIEPSSLIVVSNEVGCSKPSSEIFQVFLQRLTDLYPDLRAEDCAYVDDKEANVSAA